MPEPVIVIEGLRKSYGDVEAVRGLDLVVESRQIHAVLGPNGAGKTTTLEILEGYVERDAGRVSVLGVDPADATSDWRQRIGIVLQETALETLLTVRESLELYAGYYASPRPVDEVIELVGLQEKDAVRAGRLSGGQKRRLDVGIALIGDPDLLFLDEPTTGFDPSARRQAWQMIAGLREIGKTVLLTTHYMEEAQFLADRVAVVNRGRVVADDTPGRLGDRENLPTRISFHLPPGFDPVAASSIAGFEVTVVNGEGPGEGPGAVFASTAPTRDLNRLTEWAISSGIELSGLEVRRPSLEDVYLELTS
jgi:ABC-2 type transport system ATP-binding protein